MTSHGGKKTLKRLNTPGHLQIKRKHGTFFVSPTPGPHPKRFCLPLLHIVRDLLEIVPYYRDAKKLIGQGNFKVDGKIVKDTKFPIGLMDILTIEKLDKNFRILPDSHHGLKLFEIPKDEAEFKLCRINGKTTLNGGHIQLNLHDGRNIKIEVKDPTKPKEDVYKRMDVLKIAVPSQEILSHIKFETNSLAMIMDGKNIGQVGTVSNIIKRFGPNASTVEITQEDGTQVETLYDYVLMLGDKESEIKIPINES
jgi:small subunit ribosomal protein S4e